MFRSLLPIVATFGLLVAAQTAWAQFPQGNSPNPLFSQYVTQGAGSPSAAIYPAPHWSPLLGAQSYYTYQPLMPHEMMYQHSRNYYNYYNEGYYGGGQGLVKTSVRWQAGNNHMGPLPFSTGLSGAAYRFNARRYGLDTGTGSGISRGRTRRVRGGLGSCATGTCESEGEIIVDGVYSGDSYQGEISSGCTSGTCAAKPNPVQTQR